MKGDRTYVGAAWRSRFLRAPKVALQLSKRADFVPIAQLAKASLGLKTGADRFFFLSRDLEPAGDALKVLPSGVAVRGFEGWRGRINANDMLPALVGPHEMFGQDKRRFSVPRKTERLYLWPRSSRMRSELAAYVRLAEIAGVNAKTLVQQNGGADWWKQVRTLVTDRWAMPYNSAYDYGAWDNSVGAVLNGRFVGVSACEGVDDELLGAALNSTFAMVGRLLEGMATGTEGAFDVGPPAVRRILVPDVRRFNANGAEQVSEVMSEIRRQDVMPSGPSAAGSVPPLRRHLDQALLEGLGSTAGQAAIALDELYAGYGRWRKDVEDVERQMQQNRRVMSRSGQTRTARPVDLAGRRVWEEISSEVERFPSHLLHSSETMQIARIPRGAQLAIDAPLFDAGVITNGRETLQLGDHQRVRYVAMLREIGFEGDFSIPTDALKSGIIADRFETAMRKLREVAAGRAAAYVGSDQIAHVVEVVVENWKRACREGGQHIESTSPGSDADRSLKSKALH